MDCHDSDPLTFPFSATMRLTWMKCPCNYWIGYFKICFRQSCELILTCVLCLCPAAHGLYSNDRHGPTQSQSRSQWSPSRPWPSCWTQPQAGHGFPLPHCPPLLPGEGWRSQWFRKCAHVSTWGIHSRRTVHQCSEGMRWVTRRFQFWCLPTHTQNIALCIHMKFIF